MKTINQILKSIIDAIYPNKCICCGEILDDDVCICEQCDKHIERVNTENICLDCGFEKENCVCKYSVYRYDSLVCAFNNVGIAKRTYYAYKFSKKQHYVNFFAKEIADVVCKCYNVDDFDLICSVPTFNVYGYDHSGYLAKEVSNLLDIPFADGLLVCVKRGKKQHKSNIRERLDNVNGKYLSKYRIDNKNVLLIDDIKTTGATLDECTRVLLFSGAESVCCATALGASITKK